MNSKRDWGHAKDYVRMQWLMLQQTEPEDFVIATGRMETVRKFIEICAKKLKWDTNADGKGIIWEGTGLEEVGRRADTKEIVIKIDPRYFRPTEVEELRGDSQKSFKKLGWEPEFTLEEMIEEMIKEDKNKAMQESFLKKEGFQISSNFESPPTNKN